MTLRFQQFSVADSFWLMIVGGINLLIIGLYLEYALPKEFGRSRHPLFFLMCCCDGSRKKNKEVGSARLEGDEHETKYLDRSSYEGVSYEVAKLEKENRILKISDLEKCFDNGFKAVNGVNLKLY